MSTSGSLPNIPLASMVIPSPIGELTLVASDSGLVRLGFVTDQVGVMLEAHEESAGPGAKEILEQAARELAEYFSGHRRHFEVALDLSLPEGFRTRASKQLQSVPYGDRVTYAELAKMAGNPKAARAAGTVCALNPIPIFIPCHRVVRSDQSTGDYRGGADTKEFLLSLEAAADGS